MKSILLLILLCGVDVTAFCCSPVTPAITRSSRAWRHPFPPAPIPTVVRSSRITKTARAAKTSSTMLSMAMPGKSEAQRKQEREQEIRAKMSKLKSEGRMNKKGAVSTEDSMMLEAEQFFNKESPMKRYQQKKLAREQREAEQKKLEEGEEENVDDE